MMKSPPPRAARLLEQVLLANLAVHALAMLTMAVLLLPGMPGGPLTDSAERAAYVAGHPWLWRLGWLPWQLCALVDLLTGVALLRTAWVPRLPAWLTLLATAVAVVPDQVGQLLWITRGIALAGGNLVAYAAFEADTFRLIAVWGGTLYLLMALGWTWCFAASGAWNRSLTGLSVATWGVLGIGCAVLWLPAGWQLGPVLGALANALGFVLLLAWLAGVTERVLRRSRPDEGHGRLAPWRHPRPGLAGRLCDRIAGSRLARACGEWLPPLALVSDITDVLYVNYLVDAELLTPFVPPGLVLQRLGPDGRYALFTFLSYRHGHFGPPLLGPLRRLLPSPIHTNWRIYVRDPHTGRDGIYFVTNAIDRTLHALAARLLSEGMPMHVLARGAVEARPDGSFRLLLDPGAGSGPDADATFRPGQAVLPSGPWSMCFADYRAMLAYCVPQDRALSPQPWYGRVTRQEIGLNIPLEACQPLDGAVYSRAAERIVGPARPLSFRVPTVAFRFDGEHHDPLPPDGLKNRGGPDR